MVGISEIFDRIILKLGIRQNNRATSPTILNARESISEIGTIMQTISLARVRGEEFGNGKSVEKRCLFSEGCMHFDNYASETIQGSSA